MPESHIERETNLSFGSTAILPDGGGLQHRVAREGPESGTKFTKFLQENSSNFLYLLDAFESQYTVKIDYFFSFR